LDCVRSPRFHRLARSVQNKSRFPVSNHAIFDPCGSIIGLFASIAWKSLLCREDFAASILTKGCELLLSHKPDSRKNRFLSLLQGNGLPNELLPLNCAKIIVPRFLRLPAWALAWAAIAPLLFYPANGGDLGGIIVNDKIPITGPRFCDLFDHATIYDNPDTLALQKFSFTGRLQADAAFFEADKGDFDELLWRRFRMGAKSKHFNDITIHAEASFDLVDSDPLYEMLTDANVEWAPSDAFALSLGKQSALFTMDGATSSKKLLRMERGLLANNLWFSEEYFTGATISGEVDHWIYYFGIFSSDGGPEFGDFEAGNFSLLSLGYDFADTLHVDKAILRADYVHNDPSGQGVLNTGNFAKVGSLNAVIENGKWGLRSDFATGEGLGAQSDLFGIEIMPYYNLTDKLQLVSSYNSVHSNEPNGARFGRYENRIERGRADEIHEFYFGFNYYLCEHNLKWQTGVQYTSAEDIASDGGNYDGWGLSSGIRISW
jgi:phosphate-selective porin OprO/OprP